jgi:hypothetical protein
MTSLLHLPYFAILVKISEIAYCTNLVNLSFRGTKVPIEAFTEREQCLQVKCGNPPLMATASDTS